MPESDLADEVAAVLDVERTEFQRRVDEEADLIAAEIDDGTFDNPQGIVGLEYEFYAVAADDADQWTDPDHVEPGSLARLPRRLLEYVGFEKELGLHNAEMSTSPDPLNGHGLRAQSEQVAARLEAARDPMRAEGLRLVSDGLWTIAPAGETAWEYLTDSVEIDDVRVATNMSSAVRYHAMSNADLSPDMTIDAPHVSLDADTVMPESIITSIQPHYQVPHARDLPDYFRYALRIAGPLLAMAVNSPLFPPDLYDSGTTPEEALDDGWDEHRIAVFESVLNGEGHDKVRFPRDLTTVEQALDRIAADETMVPMPVTEGDRFDDQFAHFRHKHGTYWRWVRPVFGGPTRSDANARIEFRPLPGQPTVRDTIALQAAFAGLLVGLRSADHPVADLDWETVEENFYAAARNGLDADLTWITGDGERTSSAGAIADDLLAHADAGLAARGVDEDARAHYLDPLGARVAAETTPADWKRARVRERLADGEAFADAVAGMQRTYLEKQRETLLTGCFADWLQ
ncbi:MAG: hypothetical protein ABEJ68_03415 [Halobacteriaceae archaeon]